MKRFKNRNGMAAYQAGQCIYGLKTRGLHRGQLIPAKKPAKFMTNSRAIGGELSRKWPGVHQHQCLVDGRVAEAARHPEGLSCSCFAGSGGWWIAAFRENARLIVRRLGRVGNVRASSAIQNSESTHHRLRRVYENAAEHRQCMITTGKRCRRY